MSTTQADNLRARTLVAKAIRKGLLVRSRTCQQCGAVGRPGKGRGMHKIHTEPEAHHNDYTKPLQVEWLCKRCHSKRHQTRADSLNETAPKKKKTDQGKK